LRAACVIICGNRSREEAALEPTNNRNLTHLFEEHRDYVFTLAYYVIGNSHLAEDVTQEVFLKLCGKQLATGGLTEPRAFLRRVAVNAAIDCARREHSRWNARARSGLTDECHENRPQPNDADDAIWTALGSMKPKLRAVLLLKYFEDLSIEEIAQSLGVPVNTVKSRLRRAREVVRKRLQNRKG